MKKREASFQILFKHWVLAQPKPECSQAWELKRTTKESIAFNAVVERQVQTLLQVEGRGSYYKIPDDSIGYKPYDCELVIGHGWVVIAFGERITEFFMIRVNDWLHEKEISERKSITRERAREIGMTIAVGKRD